MGNKSRGYQRNYGLFSSRERSLQFHPHYSIPDIFCLLDLVVGQLFPLCFLKPVYLSFCLFLSLDKDDKSEIGM